MDGDDDDWDQGEDWEVDDYVDESYDEDDDDDSETVECAECGADVYEDAERCPACGNYIVHGSSGYVWKNRPLWWVVLGFLGVLAVIAAFAFGP